MNGITHKIGGASAGIITYSLISTEFGLPLMAVCISSSILGSLVPDIDEPNSIAGKKAKLLSKSFKFIFGHRGIIHTPLFLGILVGVYWVIGKKYIPPDYLNYANYAMLSFSVGYISHLFLDMLTPQGIMLLFPLTKYHFKLIGLRNKHKDIIVSSLLIMGTVMFLLIRNGYILINTELVVQRFDELLILLRENIKNFQHSFKK